MLGLELPPEAAEHYDEIRAVPQRKGAPIGPNDLWIAAHARAAGFVLVSNNECEFRRVPGLKVENWARGDQLAVELADCSDLPILVTMKCGNGPELRVHDTGRAVPLEVARQLLRVPVRSMRGLGIGLYQAARHAESSGFALTLSENCDGAACFALRRAG